MSEIFADTFYYLAILNPKDPAHAKAAAFGMTCTSRVVLTHWVLMEIGDALSGISQRPKFLALLASLDNDPAVTIVPASEDLFRRGVDLYRRRPDKDWPLTDCISFLVMQDRGITEALTGDEHFRQAGFVPLLHQP